MSFFKRLALFIVILTVMILFFGLFPVVAKGASDLKSLQQSSFKMHHAIAIAGKVNFDVLLP